MTLKGEWRQEGWRAQAFEAAPFVAAALAFVAGALTLLTVAAPALPLVRGLGVFDRFVEELPELSVSLGGVALMALATGLSRRIDAAWAATTALLGALCLYALFRHNHVVAASLAGVSAVSLALMRRAFYRHSRLGDLAPDRRVALAIAFAFGVAIVGALLWAGSRPTFAQAPWWSLLTDEHLGRPGRAIAAAAAGVGFLLAQHFLLSRRPGTPPLAASADIVRADMMIGAAEAAPPDAELAFTGDKSFLFVEDAFVMVARSGSSLVAMGPPVGKRAAWTPALRLLREEADRLALRPVVYAAPPELLPNLLELGFRVEKVGENAIIDLKDFSLVGSARQKLRNARRRVAEREGISFEVMTPPHEALDWAALKAVSDAWLPGHGGKEKAFSLGAYDEAYLRRHAIAVARRGGDVIAFANLWRSADGERGALDLMRFDPEGAPNGLMDFLFTEILLWAQAHGLKTFDLGMAPLAGLAEEKYASMFARLGRLVHERGEPFYGFQGLRVFKDKFGPRWEPRYIAAPGAWALPIVLAEVAMLSNAPQDNAAAGI